MSDAADEFLREHLDEDNAIRWPRGEAARSDAAQTLFGVKCVRNADYWYGFARDLIVNPEPKEPYARAWSDAAKKDRAYRDAFATLNDQQRQAVLRLLHQAIYGTTFSMLSMLDQFPYANIVMEFRNREETDEVYAVRVLPGEFNLHERWHQWVKEFSNSPQP